MHDIRVQGPFLDTVTHSFTDSPHIQQILKNLIFYFIRKHTQKFTKKWGETVRKHCYFTVNFLAPQKDIFFTFYFGNVVKNCKITEKARIFRKEMSK